MASELFLEKSEYSGWLKPRDIVPGGETWVFQNRRGITTAVRGMDSDSPRPPAKPWLPMEVYKFRNSATYPWEITVFDGTGLATRVKVQVTAELIDPLLYILTGQYEQISTTLQPALEAALRSALAIELQEQVQWSVVPIAMHDLSIPELTQLLPDADLSRYVQGRQEFRDMGIRVRVVVHQVSLPPAYEEIRQKATLALQAELLEAKQQMIAAATKVQVGLTELELRKQLYSGVVGYTEQILPRLENVMNNVVQQATGIAASVDPEAAGAVFKDLLREIIPTIKQSLGGDGLGQIDQASAAQNSDAQGQGARLEQLRELYALASSEGWAISPARVEQVKESVDLDFGSERSATLTVPPEYPRKHPTIRAKDEHGRVAATLLRQIQPLLDRGASLAEVAQQVEQLISPP